MPDLDVKKLNELPVASVIADTDLLLVANPTTGAMKQVTKAVLNNYYASPAYVLGMRADRGNYDASVIEWPTDDGSGIGGEVLRGDRFIISVAGTIDGVILEIGDTITRVADGGGLNGTGWTSSKCQAAAMPSGFLKGKWFVGIVDQNGTSAPTVRILQNDFTGYTPTGARLGGGEYSISLPTINPAKRFLSFTFNQYDSSVSYQRTYLQAVGGGGGEIRISVGGGPFGGDSWLNESAFLIADFT